MGLVSTRSFQSTSPENRLGELRSEAIEGSEIVEGEIDTVSEASGPSVITTISNAPTDAISLGLPTRSQVSCGGRPIASCCAASCLSFVGIAYSVCTFAALISCGETLHIVVHWVHNLEPSSLFFVCRCVLWVHINCPKTKE